jgi:adenine-specific DNA-methyltransferase
MPELNPNQEPEKLDLSSLDVVEQKRRELAELFPEVRTEGGKIDFERLKSVLGESVDVGRERYGMNWPGKAECMRAIQAPSMGTLLPMPEESLDWDTTENVIIEGDNLEVLKLLQKSYLGKIKMIYIDPPYNTGNDLVYPDNYGESLDTYLRFTGQIDVENRQYTPNTETQGRFHSKWLNMMFPRLYMARQLLCSDGIVAISIDETEHTKLVSLCDQIFGEENFAGEIVWKNSSKNDEDYVSIQHEYIVFYVKDKTANLGQWRERKEGLEEIYKAFEGFRKKHGQNWLAIHKEAQEWFKQFPASNPISDSSHYSWMDARGVYFPDNISGPNHGQYRYDVLHPTTGVPCKEPESGWRFPEDKMIELIAQDRIHFGPDHTTVPNKKTYLRDTEYQSLTSIKIVDGRAASKRLQSLFGSKVFTNPKDEVLLARIMKAVGVHANDVVLDFFAGSGSTGHAVKILNSQQGSECRSILIQLPEDLRELLKTARGSAKQVTKNAIALLESIGKEANLYELCVERMRRVFAENKLIKESSQGFRCFKLSASCFVPWDGTASNDADQLAQQLQLGVDHTRTDRTADDLLYEVLLKSWGEPALSLKIAEETIEDVRVFSVAEGAFLICLEESLTLEFIRALAARKPDRVVMRESAFKGNDQLKANAVQTFKSQGVTSFKVV